MPDISYSDLPYSEVSGSPVENWTDKGLTATVDLYSPWASRYDLVADILGNRRIYPYSPWSLAEAKEAAIKPFGEGIPSADKRYFSYEAAQVTLKYAYASDESKGPGNGGELASISLEPTAEFLTLDPKNFRWKNPVAATAENPTPQKLPDAAAPGLILRGFDLVYTQFEVSNIPTAILTLPSTVNNASITFSLLGLTCPAETLCYQPPSIEKRITTQQVEKWKLTHRLSYRANGWNRYFNPDAGIFDEIVLAGTATVVKPYPLADWSPLFAVS